MSEVAVASRPGAQAAAEAFQIADLAAGPHSDWPGRRVLAITAQGCPWCCTYCYVPDLQNTATEARFSWADALAWLETDGQQHPDAPVQGVLFTGGEATRQEVLADAMRQMRERGLGIALHTSGAYPERLEQVLPLVDRLVLDIKAMPEGYEDVTGKPASGAKAWRSLETAIAWGGELDVRLTVDPTTHSKESVLAVVRRVVAMGGPQPILQQARAEGANPEFVQALGGRGIADVLDSVEGLQILF